jgi:hypothetical protein
VRKFLPLLIALALLGTVACSSVKTQADMVGLHYGGGPIENPSFKGCVEPGQKEYNGPGDIHFLFPTNQRSYDATGAAGSERGPFTVVSDDSAELNVPVSVTFTLKSDCETLQKFHEIVANKYGASLNEDGTAKAGWVNMLHFIIGKPLDVTLDRISQGYDWREIWNDESVRIEYQNAINEELPGLVQERTGDVQFFEDFTALVQKPDPVDDGLKAAIVAEQKAVAEARAQETAAGAQEAVARAEAEVEKAKAEGRIAAARADAESKRLQIEPWGDPETFAKAQASVNGVNPWQPTILYGAPVPAPQSSE